MKPTSDLQVKKRKAFHFATLILALAALAATTAAKPQSITYEADNEHNSASIEGSWIFDIDVYVAQQHVATFNSLISFARGGVVVTTPSVPPLSIYYGVWNRMKSEAFNTVLYTFAPDSTGSGVVLQRLNLRSHLTGINSLVGTGGRSTCDLQGENCVDDPVVFQFTGKRMVPKQSNE